MASSRRSKGPTDRSPLLSRLRIRPVSSPGLGAAEIRECFMAVDGPGVEALVQVGTNLVCSTLVEELEAQLGKPVIAVNTATAWAALRHHGITDRLQGWGRLLSEH